ncbi:MAG: hypothetical protein ACI4MK_06335, partial [Aristaeellaceae bacterium]
PSVIAASPAFSQKCVTWRIHTSVDTASIIHRLLEFVIISPQIFQKHFIYDDIRRLDMSQFVIEFKSFCQQGT